MDRCSVMWCITALLIQLVVMASTEETIVNMDKSQSNSQCGKVFVLSPSHDVRLKSKGLAPDGYCGISVFAPTEVDNYTCDALCVTFKTASMKVCDVKLKFVGHMFGKSGDLVREFSCHKRQMNSFCWEVSSVRIEVIESYNYAYNEKKPNYEFDVDVSARCSLDSEGTSYPSMKAKLAEDEHKNYVEGIAVGVSLACVFLIVLFFAWCYTKHQAVTGSPADRTPRSAPPPAHKKGNLISTFRKKLNIRRKTEQDSENAETATYRKTDGAGGKPRPADSETAPLTSTRDPGSETFELANEEIDMDKEAATGEESPKDGGAEAAGNLDIPEVVVKPATPEPQGDGIE